MKSEARRPKFEGKAGCSAHSGGQLFGLFQLFSAISTKSRATPDSESRDGGDAGRGLRQDRRFFLVPTGGLLVGVGEAQNGGLAKGFAQQLQTDGQLRRSRKTARHADAAKSGEIAGDGED